MMQREDSQTIDVATILVATDDAALLTSLRNVLEDRGLDVLTAHDGSAVVDLSRHFAIDLAILDVLFVDMDGFRVCQALRAQCDAPIIMFSVPPETGPITCLELEADATLALIATQQPLLHDLRTLAAVLNIVTDLERMGDHAEGNATICLMIGDEKPIKPLLDIPRMADAVTEMLEGALRTFVDHDLVAARRIARDDDNIDALYNPVYRELLPSMMDDPHTIHQATLLLWVAHNLERMGDRVTNICERVIFTETGRMQELKVG